MSPEVLENIFVQRQELAQELVDRIRESVLTSAKHHTLLTGSRGIGKTHLVSLVYHRICKIDDLRDRILIAWLSEEEWSVTSFLDLLLCIFQALQDEFNNSKGAQPCPPKERVESLYEMSVDAADSEGATLLKDFIGERTLLLLVENLDDLFAGLGKDGQKQLRTFLEENSCINLATAQSLFKDVKQKNSPFYGFFCHEELKELKADDATQLLANIAKHNKNDKLASFIQTQTGRDRIKAVHFLAGGNHRLYVIFSEFLTHQESLDQLVNAFMRTLDDLTPYYQERMRYLSPQQRKIIDFLCDRRHPVPVKEIAQYCFITHQTASSQLKKLLEMAYVRSYPEGRESFYELREVLMRFCLEVKKQRGEPIQLFVDFLRLWYTKQELQERLERLSSGEMLQAPSLEREYVLHALQEISHDSVQQQSKVTDANATVEASDEDPCVAAYWEEYEAYKEENDWLSALSIAEKLVAIRGNANDWFQQGYCLGKLQRYEEAIASFDKAIELKADDHYAWILRGIALYKLGQFQEAVASYEKAIELKADDHTAWNLRGIALNDLGQFQEAVASYEKAIELKADDHYAWYFRGIALDDLGQFQEAVASYDKAIELKADYYTAWNNRGNTLRKLGQFQEAVASYEKVIELKADDYTAWNLRGIALSQLGQFQEAVVSFDKAIELKADDHSAWNFRGNTLRKLGQFQEAVASYDKAIELKADDPDTWYFRGNALDILGRYEEALVSCDKAIELGDQSSSVFFNRAIALLGLNRWDKGIAELENALDRLSQEQKKEAYAEDAELIFRHLFNSTKDTQVWKIQLSTLIALYDKYQVASTVGQGLVASIPALMSDMVSDKAARTWLEVWRELVSDRPEFQIPLRLLNTAVRYRQTKGDKRVLLELPIEERKLLKPLLGIEEP